MFRTKGLGNAEHAPLTGMRYNSLLRIYTLNNNPSPSDLVFSSQVKMSWRANDAL